MGRNWNFEAKGGRIFEMGRTAVVPPKSITEEKLSDDIKAKINRNLLGSNENGGVVLNDIENNEALCEFSSSIGQETTAGMRAFRILEVIGQSVFNEENTLEGPAFRLDSIEGLEEGDTFSLVLNLCCNDCGTITNISAEGNWVQVSSIPEGCYLVSAEKAEEQPWENTLSINEKPDIGTIDVGFGALSTGVDTIALRVGSVATGYKTHSIWIGSDAGGIKTWAGFAAFARGAYSEAWGDYSYAGGERCKVYCGSGFAHGVGLISSDSTQAQALFGRFNIIDDEAVFIVAYGSSNNDRKNVFVVKRNGRVTLGANPIDDMDAVTKGYVDDRDEVLDTKITTASTEISKANTEITKANNALKAEQNSLKRLQDAIKILEGDNLYTIDIVDFESSLREGEDPNILFGSNITYHNFVEGDFLNVEFGEAGNNAVFGIKLVDAYGRDIKELKAGDIIRTSLKIYPHGVDLSIDTSALSNYRGMWIRQGNRWTPAGETFVQMAQSQSIPAGGTTTIETEYVVPTDWAAGSDENIYVYFRPQLTGIMCTFQDFKVSVTGERKLSEWIV